MDAWFSAHLGIISAAKLVECGCGDRNIAQMVDKQEELTLDEVDLNL